MGFTIAVGAWPRFLGDLDGDGRATVVDLTRLRESLNGLTPLPPKLVPFADVNQDGQVNQADVPPLIDAIFGKSVLPALKDTDRDGLPDLIETAIGLNPNQADSNNNGIRDGDEDPDNDGLANLQEIAQGTDPDNADTDGDGWNDEAELAGGSDPLLAASVPRLWCGATPPVTVSLPSPAGGQGMEKLGLTLAIPPVAVVLPSAKAQGSLPPGFVMATPPVSVALPALELTGGIAGGLTMAAPPVTVVLTSSDISGGLGGGITLAKPVTTVVLPAGIAAGGITLGDFLALPPVRVKIAGQ